MSECCEHCKWWDEYGNCRRLPPSPIQFKDLKEENLTLAVWPLTNPEDFCGEFTPTPSPESEPCPPPEDDSLEKELDRIAAILPYNGFWGETIIRAAAEIRKLREQIKELESRFPNYLSKTTIQFRGHDVWIDGSQSDAAAFSERMKGIIQEEANWIFRNVVTGTPPRKQA